MSSAATICISASGGNGCWRGTGRAGKLGLRGRQFAFEGGGAATLAPKLSPCMPAAQPSSQRAGDIVEDRGNDGLDIALIEMRVCRRKLLNKLGFRHGEPAR